MHRNVWEWCLDVWHDNYNGAPTNGSAWETGGNSKIKYFGLKSDESPFIHRLKDDGFHAPMLFR